MKVKGTSNSKHDDCELEYVGVDARGTRRFFCKAHQQWTYVFPISRTYTYDIETGLPQITISIHDI